MKSLSGGQTNPNWTKIAAPGINAITNDSKKLLHYTNYLLDNKSNLKKVWQGINQIINLKSKNCSSPTCLVQNGSSITDPKAIAENFNSYFSTIADSILKERKYEGNKSFRDFLHNPSAESFAFDPAEEAEVSALISKNKE